MPTPIVPPTANANSYATVSDGDTLAAGRMGASAWSGATTAEKETALVAATARLEQEEYEGVKTDPAQPLKWPRVRTYDDDGEEYATAAVPAPVRYAAIELAIYYLANKTTDTQAPSGLDQFQALTLGPLSVTPNPAAPEAGALPPAVRRWLRGLVRTQGPTRLRRSS